MAAENQNLVCALPLQGRNNLWRIVYRRFALGVDPLSLYQLWFAYAIKFNSLPQPNDGMDWQTADSFNAADELLKNPGLKDVFKVAIEKGYALIVKPG